MNINARDLISSAYSEPSFFVNFFKIARPLSKIADDFTYRIQKHKSLQCWRIQDKELIKTADNLGIFFDAESYIIMWLFDLKIDNTLVEELLVYYWSGQNAVKGFSPVPPEVEEHTPVERIVQWSEPALFFHSFPRSIITFSGRQDRFDCNEPHLLLIRGELVKEIHLYEVPCEKLSLRSRATFLLIMPKDEVFLYWHGVGTSFEGRENIVKISQPHDALKQWQKSWANFSIKQIHEKIETTVFLERLQGSPADYHSLQLKTPFTPRLFYLNSITGSFLATEVQYPLRSHGVIAPFPFLQTHLYTAIQPALFLLDNLREIWLWEGTRDSTCDNKGFEQELRWAQELLVNYMEEKEKLLSIKISAKHVFAHKEPLEFKNIFPLWKEVE